MCWAEKFQFGVKACMGGVLGSEGAAADAGAGAEERSGEKTQAGRGAVDVQCSHP